MKIGLIYPQSEFGNDPDRIREYAQSAEALGYSHILVSDHVLGANPVRSDKLPIGQYTHEHAFQEPLVLLGFIAAATRVIGLATGIVILPQRQAVLVAKQAATVDVLSGGRLRLGVGLGVNEVEYIALGQSMKARGARIEEQIEVMRRLWTERLVVYSGKWDDIPDACLLPMPVQRPIPIWFGGQNELVLRRAARIGDGWIPPLRVTADAQSLRKAMETMDGYLQESGRSLKDFGIEARLNYGAGDETLLRERLDEWRRFGVSHASLNTEGAGLKGDQAHLDVMRRFARVAELQPS